MKRALTLCSLALGAAQLTGCARAVVTTEVKPDGAWTRTLRFAAPAPDPKSGMQAPQLEEAFALPSGAPWQTTRERVKDEVVFTARRTLRAGETLREDIVVSGGKEAPKGRAILNEVVVREVQPGRLEYREVLRWQGPRPKEVVELDPQLVAAVKQALPPTLATDAHVQDLARTILRRQARLFFGPPAPLLGQLLFHPDLAVRRMERRLTGDMTRWLQEKSGNSLSPAEQEAAVRRLIAVAADSDPRSKAKGKLEAGPPAPGESSSNMASLLFTVTLPGKLIATNGEKDEETGEVTWALLSEAVAMEDIVMTATCEIARNP